MKVLFAPKYGSNPYQANLSGELSQVGTKVQPLEPTVVLSIVRGLFHHPDVDIIHFHWLDGFYTSRWLVGRIALVALFALQLLLLKLLGVTVIWTVHNCSAHEIDERLEWPIKRFFVQFICDRMILHCEAASTILIETYSLPEEARERMTVIPHGHYIGSYPDDVSRSEARDRLSVGDDSTVFLFFGEIRPYKNVEELVETFRRTCGPNCELLVAGRPHTAEDREAVVTSTATDDRITTQLQFIPEENVQLYMNAADLVVLPFREILTSGSAILAMSFGRPFAAPAVGCLPEIAGDNAAMLYSNDDPDALADTLRRAETVDLEKMGERGRDRIRNYNWKLIAARTARVYETAA